MKNAKTRKRRYGKTWFKGLTNDHEALFLEMIVPLTSRFRAELFKKLGELICGNVNYEVVFSNYSLAMIARRILELFFDEWYHKVPLIFMEKDRKTLFVNWADSRKEKEILETKIKTKTNK